MSSLVFAAGEVFLTGSFERRDARSKERASVVSRLESLLTKALEMPWLAFLRTFIHKILAVMEPFREMRISHFPQISFHLSDHGITVVSANLWHDWPFRRRLTDRLEAFAQLVESEGADVVLLQEVIRSPDINADEWLAHRLGMARVYTRANGDESTIGFEEGLAVLSRFPIHAPQRRSLGASEGFLHRIALATEVVSPLGKLFAVSVHLGILKRTNHRQWVDLQNWVKEMAGGRTALIGGDFNAHEDTYPIQQAQDLWVDTFRLVNPQVDGATHELRLPWGKAFRRRRLDYLFLQPGLTFWTVEDARHLDTPHQSHSDHRAVLARLVPN
jgi:endonuclease/exonuclease/phosphatase family metal-dependent hydrolase